MNENTSYLIKNWLNKNVSDFTVYIIKFIWFKKFDHINLTMY